MIITNLLDKPVSTGDLQIRGRICAIYEFNGGIRLGIVDETGKLLFNVPTDNVQVYNPNDYAVIMYYIPEKRIQVIKALRTAMAWLGEEWGLRETKDFVDAHPNKLTVRDNLSLEKANGLSSVLEGESRNMMGQPFEIEIIRKST